MVGNNDSGVNLGAKDENERTLLHWVGATGRLDVDEFLLGREIERYTVFAAAVICLPRYKTHQTLEPLPSLRVSVTAIHSPMDLKAACKIIAEEAMAVKEVLATSPVDLASGSSLRKRKQ
ncbi:hypothetical protein PF011_g13976 [Phytophthora fragariae]|nr:hypothetical protein PF011_g13976 [Phytophthora fragariae]